MKTTKFTITIEHDDNVDLGRLEQIIDEQTSTFSGCYHDLDPCEGDVNKVTVEPV